MSLLDAHSAELIAAAEQAPAPLPTKAPTQRFSTWGLFTAAPKGVAAGAAEGMASGADVGKAIADKVPANVSGPLGQLPFMNAITSVMQVGADILNPKEGQFTSEVGTSLRNVSKDYTPDPQTAHVAESAVFNLMRVGSKALTAAAMGGNIPGAVVAGAEEGFTQSDMLARQGVDIETRSKVGAVTAVTNAAGFALPVAGKTWAQTGALALVGGPASFMAQNAATREILQAADYSKLADQYDPLDPVGLALSTVLPLGFGALAMRGAKVKPGVDAKGPMPDGSPPPVKPPEPEIVDAARVNLVREHMDATNPARDDMATHSAHADAYTKAMEQQAEGKAVSIMDVAPKIEPMAGKATDTPNFKAWFGDSKVVDDTGAPMVVYHGTAKDFDSFDPSKTGATFGTDKAGLFFISSKAEANKYADMAPVLSGGNANVLPVFVKIQNPHVAHVDFDSVQQDPARWFDERKYIVEKAISEGRDGVIVKNNRGDSLVVAFDPKQIKSAIGNSGKFDPNSGSLTDNPIADWGANLKKSLDDMAAKVANIDLIEAGRIRKSAEAMRDRGMPDVAAKYDDLALSHELKAARDSAFNPATLASQADGVKPSPIESRLADIEARNPAALDAMIATQFDDNGKPTANTTLREYLDSVKREAAQEADDSKLVEVAVNCFLSGGV
jgi:hypothetical protein